MNTTSRRIRSNSGMALLTALMFISITVLVLTALMGRYVQQRLQTDHFEDYYVCFEAAQAAVEQGKSALNGGDLEFRVGISESWEPTFNESTGMLELPDIDGGEVTPAHFVTVPDVEYIAYLHNWEIDGRDTNGDGTIDSPAEEGMFSIHTAARMNGVTRTLEAVYNTRNFGIWNNAIFAGRGQAGRLINGNVKVHGSVHLLGDDLPEGAPAVEALDMSGTAMILNDYSGIVADLQARVPPIQIREYNGEDVSTLNTELRVRNGIVAMSGNAHVGVEWSSGSGYKGPVDGTFVTDGWGGTSGTTNVNSDNGHDEPYDLGSSIGLPLFEDNYRDKDTGDFVHNPGTGTWYTHAEYFEEVLVGGPGRLPAGGTLHADVSIDADKGGFYYNATTGAYATGSAANTASPAAADHYMLKKTTSPLIRINGCIHIDGDLEFTGRQKDLTYYGRAALMVEGGVEVATHMLSGNSPTNINDYAASFPYTSCLGVMSRGQMDLGTVSQRQIMGAWYSADNVTMSKQSQVMGTCVGRDFEMGHQVPDIFQVPVLADNLPLGMIGDYPIFRLQPVSWREIGV